MSKYPTDALANATPADLAWISGRWKGKHKDDSIEEHWSGYGAAGTLMGMFRWERDGAVRFYELIVIESDEGRVCQRIKHMNPGIGLKSWEEQDKATEFILVQLEHHKAVFLQINKPNAPWMIYRLQDENTFVAYFETEDKTPEASDMFVYQRMSS